MGHASEAGIDLAPTSQDLPDGSFLTQSPATNGYQANAGETLTHTTTQDTLVQYQTSGPEPNSFLLNHDARSATSSSSRSSWSRFAIPTKNGSLASGFAFHPRLYELKVTPDQWFLFTNDVVNAAKMTLKEDYLAWTAGITAGTLTAPFLLIFSPFVGYYSGKAVHKKTLLKTVKEKLTQEGDLRLVLKKWNEETFMQKGFQAWLELPRDSGELHDEPHGDDASTNKGTKEQKRVAKEEARRFRIIIISNNDADAVPIPSTPQTTGRSSASGSSVQPAVRPPVETGVRALGELPPAYSNTDGSRQIVSSADTTNHPTPAGNGNWPNGYSKN